MTTLEKSELLLCGSVPMESTEQVFETCGPMFGDSLAMIPDGETGERQVWVVHEAYRLHRPHPDIETVWTPVPKRGVFGHEVVPDWVPAHIWDIWQFKIKPGVTELRYERWPRIDDAIESYAKFRELRDKGAIPSDLRFQVGLPWPVSAFGWFFWENFADDYEIFLPAWEELVGRELQRLLREIPAEDLAIQWDVCFEVLDLEGLFHWTNREQAWERFEEPMQRLCAHIPDEVLLGYHICYGTFPEWPMREANDMGLSVRMANTAVAKSGRRVDWLHISGPRHIRSADDSFFRPLADLDPGDAKVYLGLMLHHDANTGTRGLETRIETAKKYLPEFGLSAYCGFGRQPGMTVEQTLRTHRQQLDAVRDRAAKA